ncbi:hypothetical protein O3P69_020600 [Scylla paramamosain]|uniref:FAS1 domain-containing protein n=1 Tax=Scylla paramamosain TaxID=85552 RepID=A0AAW0TPV8_SCYPA
MRILPLVLLVCLLGVAAGVNFNIFRWPSFNRKGRGQSGVGYGGSGGGHRGGGGGYGGGGGGGKRKGNPLRSLQRLKTQAITGLRNLKAPIIDGIRNLKSQGKAAKASPATTVSPQHTMEAVEVEEATGVVEAAAAMVEEEEEEEEDLAATGVVAVAMAVAVVAVMVVAAIVAAGMGAEAMVAVAIVVEAAVMVVEEAVTVLEEEVTVEVVIAVEVAVTVEVVVEVGMVVAAIAVEAVDTVEAAKVEVVAMVGGVTVEEAEAGTMGTYRCPSYGAPPTSSSGHGSVSTPASGYGAPSPATGFTGFSSQRPQSSSYSAPSSPAAGTSSYSSTGSSAKGVTGVRQAASSGFRATAASAGNNFASIPATGYRAPTGTGSGVRPSQTSSYSHTGTRATGSGDSSYSTQINAPLSAAMAMGHLLNEDEVVKGQPDTGAWRPVLGTSGAAPPIDVRTPVSVASTTKGQSSIGQALGTTEEPLFIDLGGAGDTTGGSSGVQVTDPAVVVDDDTYIVSATKEYDDVVLVDKGNPDDAAKALSKVVDAALLIDEKPDDHTLLVNDETNAIDSPLLIEDEARKRSLSGGRLQEHPSSVGRADNSLGSGRRSDRLQSGQESNMMFSGLMEELRLNTLMALIRRANLEAMLTTEEHITAASHRRHIIVHFSAAWDVAYENESQQPVNVRKLVGKFALQKELFMAGRVTVQVYMEEGKGKLSTRGRVWAFFLPAFTHTARIIRRWPLRAKEAVESPIFLASLVIGTTRPPPYARGFTIFAPSDSAFSLLPRSAVLLLQNNTEKLREVVLFHVVPGELRLDSFDNNDQLSSASPRGRKLRVNVYDHGSDQQVVTVNGARVRQPDMLATNGVIHVIDRVLYPMADLSILDHLTSCDTFTGANVAVTGAGLNPVLEQEGPFTVFLPTTEAFAAIDNATVSSFIQNITLLQHVLMYHIVPGAHFSEGVRDGTWLTTLAQEQELLLRVTSDGYSRRLAGVGHAARVIKHDIIATNGVIHVIDTVLRPELETPICGHF